MKRTAVALVLTLFFTSTAFSVENPWTRELPFKEGIVSYDISGTMKGKETVFVKDYGRTMAAYRTESMAAFGMADGSRELTLTTPDWVYTIDLADNTGSKQVNPQKVITEEFNRLSRSDRKKLVKNSEKLGVAMIGELCGSVEKGAGDLLGYPCDKVTAMGIDSYTLTGTNFPMKIWGSLMGVTVQETATAIDKKSVDPSKFQLPPGARIHHELEADKIMGEQINMMFRALLAGQRPVSQQEKNMGEMADAMEAFQQMQQSGGMENFQKQMQGLFGGGRQSD